MTGINNDFDFELTKKNTQSVKQKELTDITRLREKTEREIQLTRVIGKFSQPPIAGLHFSPAGIVPKKQSGKFRMTHNLSALVGCSVNDSILDHFKTVRDC